MTCILGESNACKGSIANNTKNWPSGKMDFPDNITDLLLNIFKYLIGVFFKGVNLYRNFQENPALGTNFAK